MLFVCVLFVCWGLFVFGGGDYLFVVCLCEFLGGWGVGIVCLFVCCFLFVCVLLLLFVCVLLLFFVFWRGCFGVGIVCMFVCLFRVEQAGKYSATVAT